MFSAFGFGGGIWNPKPAAGSPCGPLPKPISGDIAGGLFAAGLYGPDSDSYRRCLPGVYPHLDILGHPVGWDWRLIAQQMDEANLRRAHESGLSLMVMSAVSNRLMCTLVHSAEPNESRCNDMVNAEAQFAAARDFQSHVDAEAGGPGKGWFRLVATPAQARAAIHEGKLAVVPGLEVSEPFCSATPATCDRTRLLADIDAAKAEGVTIVFPSHMYDNMFSGEAVHQCRTDAFCPADPESWLTSGLRNAAKGAFNDARFTTVKWPAPGDCSAEGYDIGDGKCDTRGLTNDGRFLVDALTSRGMLIDTDHSSTIARDSILDLARKLNYPVMSTHTGFLEINRGQTANEGNPNLTQLKRLLAGGGMVAPLLNQGKADNIVQVPGAPLLTSAGPNCDASIYQYAQALQEAINQGANPYQVAFGSDFDGPVGWTGPCQYHDINYSQLPQGHSQITVSGKTMTYDIGHDGFANVGMYPDFIAQLKAIGVGDQAMNALMHSSEGFLRVWEHATAAAVPEPQACIDGRAQLNAAQVRAAAASQALADFEESTGFNTSGKPDTSPETTRERAGLTAAVTRTHAAAAAAQTSYAATADATRHAFSAGQVPRVCMTEDPPAPTPPPPLPKPQPTPTDEDGPISGRCRHNPDLPNC